VLRVIEKDVMPVAAEWSSLEIAKLAVGVLTPIFLFVLGYMVTKAACGVEQAQWANRKLIETRLELFEKMAPKLNDLFCFFALVGHFQEVTPPRALTRKRELDGIFHSHAVLFSGEFRDRYQEFIDTCFITFRDVAKPAQLRAPIAPQMNERGKETWDRKWKSMFAQGQESSVVEVANAYDDMMDSFANDVQAPRPGRIPRPWLEVPSETA
jgi:hypothetical protein